MIKKDLSECFVIDSSEVDTEKVFSFFWKYGNFITIIVCDGMKFKGVLTYGEWIKDNTENMKGVNTSCRFIYDDSKDLFKSAQQLFDLNFNIRTIPILNRNGEFLGVIEKYDSDADLEKELLDGEWSEFLELITAEKEEAFFLRKFLMGKQYLIIGDNYLGKQFYDLLGTTEKQKGSYDDLCTKWEFAVDLEVRHQKIREKYGYKDKKVYTFKGFLQELYPLIANNTFTKWYFFKKEEFCDCQVFLDKWKTEKIFIRSNSFMAFEYHTFYKDKNYAIILQEDLYDDLEVDGWFSDVYKSKFYSILDYYYKELEVIWLNLEYLNNIKANVKVLNFYMPDDLPLNKFEQERFSQDDSAYDLGRYTEQDFVDFFGASYRGRTWVEKLFGNSPGHWVKGRGFVLDSKNFEGVTYYNGIRFTTDVPTEYKNTIYFLGPCIVFGSLVEDRETIESVLQRKLNKENVPYRIINLGNLINTSLKKILENIDLVDGDIIVTILSNITEVAKSKCTFYDLGEAFRDIGEKHETFFWDFTIHCNGKANRRIAEFIFPYINTLINNNTALSTEWRKHSLYKVFNNDKDIDFVENKVKSYLKKVLQISGTDVLSAKKNGAIVMNANPFTYGHLYLVEEVASQVETLFIFVVEENKSFFDFKDRFAMVKEGVREIKNVIVVPSGQFIASQKTFPGYFEREKHRDTYQVNTSYNLDYSPDIRIFGKYIANPLKIKVRFAGEEPLDEVTRGYNEAMKILLPEYGVEFKEIERYRLSSGSLVSASYVRNALAEEDWGKIKELVPNSTYKYLKAQIVRPKSILMDTRI